MELWLSAEQKGNPAQPGYRHKKLRVMYKETSGPVYYLVYSIQGQLIHTINAASLN